MFSTIRIFLLVLGLSLTLISCQTPMHKAMSDVKPGMYKDQVLEIMGSPRSSWRTSGTDRWVYGYFENENFMRKEIHFQDGKVVYIGDRIEPAISAAEQDTKNEKDNAAVVEAEKERKAEAARSFQRYEENPWKELEELKKKKKGSFVPVQ